MNKQRHATVIREFEAINELAIHLARSRLALEGRDPGVFVEYRLTGTKTPDGILLYVGSKTRLREVAAEQVQRLHDAIADLRTAGWKITAPKPQEDEIE